MKTVIGIDPDTKKHGVAIYQDGELVELDTMTLVDLLTIAKVGGVDKWVIEDVTKNNFVYGRNRQQQHLVNQSIARKVGMCQQSMIELVRVLEHFNQKVVLIPPAKDNWAKDKPRFQRMTGWLSRSNEDTRSAAYFGFLGI